jgi:hypothetical protein
VSLQIAILKVLVSHPVGRATIAAEGFNLNSDQLLQQNSTTATVVYWGLQPFPANCRNAHKRFTDQCFRGIGAQTFAPICMGA